MPNYVIIRRYRDRSGNLKETFLGFQREPGIARLREKIKYWYGGYKGSILAWRCEDIGIPLLRDGKRVQR